jgi:hypothetical protein
MINVMRCHDHSIRPMVVLPWHVFVPARGIVAFQFVIVKQGEWR